MRELKKGSLGMLLLQLLQERPSYGYELCERLRTQSDGTLRFDEGAMYPLLHEYERRGLVTGYWESSDEQPPLGRKCRDRGSLREPTQGATSALLSPYRSRRRRTPDQRRRVADLRSRRWTRARQRRRRA